MRLQITGKRQSLKSNYLRYALQVKGSLPNPAKSGCLRHAPPTGKQITNRLQRTQAAGRGLLSLIARQSDKTWTPFDAHLLLRYPIADTAEAARMI